MTKSLGQIAYEADFINTTFLRVPWKQLKSNVQARYEGIAQGVAAHVRAESFHAGVDEYGYARRIAEFIWRDNYREDSPNWGALKSLAGVLSQIDNMVSGMTRTKAPDVAVEPIPHSGADELPPTFARRWRLADDGFGLQRDDEGIYIHIDDALSVLHATLASTQPKPTNSMIAERDK